MAMQWTGLKVQIQEDSHHYQSNVDRHSWKLVEFEASQTLSIHPGDVTDLTLQEKLEVAVSALPEPHPWLSELHPGYPTHNPRLSEPHPGYPTHITGYPTHILSIRPTSRLSDSYPAYPTHITDYPTHIPAIRLISPAIRPTSPLSDPISAILSYPHPGYPTHIPAIRPSLASGSSSIPWRPAAAAAGISWAVLSGVGPEPQHLAGQLVASPSLRRSAAPPRRRPVSLRPVGTGGGRRTESSGE